jgi:hypothetical protein
MTHVDNQVQVSTRTGNLALSRHVVRKQRTLAARQPSTPAATQKLTGPLSGRWSIGPDGRLRYISHGPNPWRTEETETTAPVGWPRAGFAWDGAVNARA